MRKTYFVIDADYAIYEGYTNDEHWNGWECAMFTKKVAAEIISDCNVPEDGQRAWYDEEKDTFYIKEDDQELEEYTGHDVIYGGSIMHVYDIGAYYWIWDEYKFAD